MHTSSESHSVECRYMGALCVDLATTPGSVPGHDPLRLSCDSGISPFNGGGALVMSLDSLAGWSSAQRARSPSAAPGCRPRGSSRLGDFKSFSALFRRGGRGGGEGGAAENPQTPFWPSGNARKRSYRGTRRGPPARPGTATQQRSSYEVRSSRVVCYAIRQGLLFKWGAYGGRRA